MLALLQTRRKLDAGETTSYLPELGADPAYFVSKAATSGSRIEMQRYADCPRD